MGRKLFVSFSLDAEGDRDLLRWLDAQENKSAAIRGALREHLGRGVTLGDVYQAVQDLARKVQAGTVVVCGEPGAPDVDEPAEAAAALDRLATMGG